MGINLSFMGCLFLCVAAVIGYCPLSAWIVDIANIGQNLIRTPNVCSYLYPGLYLYIAPLAPKGEHDAHSLIPLSVHFHTMYPSIPSTPPIYFTSPSPYQAPSLAPSQDSSQGLSGGAKLFLDSPSSTVIEAMKRVWARKQLERAQRKLSLDTPSYYESHSS
jgi:hypothetical protein